MRGKRVVVAAKEITWSKKGFIEVQKKCEAHFRTSLSTRRVCSKRQHPCPSDSWLFELLLASWNKKYFSNTSPCLGKASKKKREKSSQADRLGWPPPEAVRKMWKFSTLTFNFRFWFYTTQFEFYPKKKFFDQWPPQIHLKTFHDIHGFSCHGTVKKALQIH